MLGNVQWVLQSHLAATCERAQPSNDFIIRKSMSDDSNQNVSCVQNFTNLHRFLPPGRMD